jgi:hypothetical protein
MTTRLAFFVAVLLGFSTLSACTDDVDGDADDAYVVPDDSIGVAPSGTAVSDSALAAAGDAINSLDAVREARRNRSLYGREVALQDVRATTIAGDSTFFIQDPDASGDARLLVVLEDLGEAEPDPTGREGSDGRYNVDEGDVLDVEGRVDRFSGTERQVTGMNRDRLLPDSLYIRATRITSNTEDVRSEDRR